MFVVVRGKFAEDAVTVVAIFDEDLDVVSASTLDATLVALEVLHSSLFSILVLKYLL